MNDSEIERRLFALPTVDCMRYGASSKAIKRTSTSGGVASAVNATTVNELSWLTNAS